MSLNTILSIAESVTINDHRFVGQTVSRNQKILTSEILTVVPFQFNLRPMNYLLYSKSRGVLNALRIPDKALEQYLNFGRVPKLNRTMNNINNSIEETLTLLKTDKKISSEIEFKTKFTDIPPILFDRNSIKQVIWNLIINSIEAIPAEGLIEISTLKNNKHIEIKISDNGKGISPEDVGKIFEPFYTLKSEGTGLGLAIVRRIIERHEWTIHVESELGKGTIFNILIPV